MLATNYKVWDKIQSRKNVGFFTASNQNEVSAHMTNNPYTSIIWLTQGKYTIVDNENWEWLSQWKWCYSTRYAMRTKQALLIKQNIIMHRLILNAPANMCVDHINNNPLDNRRNNLRLCTVAQNLYNTRLSAGNTSGYKGVDWYRPSKYWRANIMVAGKAIYLGNFKTAKEAAKAYDEAAIKYFGEFAKTNALLGLLPKDNSGEAI